MNINDPKYIVGLGASAGGLEALEQFFDKAPDNVGAAYIVVMHLSRDFKSMLDELLARHTKMPVKPVIDGETMVGNTVYVIQPATTIEISGREFKVQSRPLVDNVGVVKTIDMFFESIAAEWKDKGCGVVLSGSGSDGADGIVAISDAGGYTCAQSPETAKFDSMPLAAISTNSVNAIDSPDQLGLVVADGMLLPSSESYVAVLSDHDAALAKILRAVVGISNIDAGQYKHSMFERRVRKRMMHVQMTSLTAYANRIESDLIEAKTLSETLLIGVTDFFRDEEAFKVIQQQVIPELIQTAERHKRPIRIWVPGCATGQEAYTLAMLFTEALQDLPTRVEVQIFATDIKRDFLGIAGRGEYKESSLESIPEKLRNKYFSPSGVNEDFYAIDPDVRKMIVFAPHNILSDPPFTRLDLVSCRNMLIYFSIEAQQKILGGFAFGLLEKGFLFLGSSETVGAQRDAFEFVNAKNRVFRRTSFRQFDKKLALPLDKTLRKTPRLGISRRTVKYREMALIPAYAALLSEYAPASLLISAERELLHSFGNVRGYLRPPEGVAHFDASEMVDKAIKTPIIAGLERSLRDRKPIAFTKIQLKEFPEPGLYVDVEVKPLEVDADAEPEHFLVIIDKSPYSELPKTSTPTTVLAASGLSEERVEKLEAELHRTREVLQSTIEEIETTNEELQSSNEELMSSNEELQSTNEELSSVNEELYSVNAEYHSQNDELTQLNNNFDLLLLSTEIGVIFLDKSLQINRFTSLAQGIFNLTEADIGRALSTFRSPFEGIDPVSLVREAIDTKNVVEIESMDEHGTSWLIRAAAHSNRQGGVLTMINIGGLRDAEAEARRTNEMLALIQKMTSAIFFEVEVGTQKVIQELGLEEYIGKALSETEGILDISYTHEDDRHLLDDFLQDEAKPDQGKIRARLWHGASETYRYVQYDIQRASDTVWRITGIDVDNYVKTQNALKEREAILEGVLRASPSLVSFVDADERYVYVNHAYEKQWNVPNDKIVGTLVKDFLPKAMYEDSKARIDAALAGERQNFVTETISKDGEMSKLSVVFEPVIDSGGKVRGFATDAMDVTDIYDNANIQSGVQKYLLAAINRSPNAIMFVDAESLVIEFANSPALRRLNVKEIKIPANTKVTRMTPSWGHDAWQTFLASADEKGFLFQENVDVFFENNQTRSMDVSGTLIVIDDERKVIVQINSTDKHKAAMDSLRERTQELARSNRDLEQFASIVAHDLRAPLRHITQFSELIEAELPSDIPEEIGEYLQLINSSTGKMADMVNGLLNYAKIGLSIPEFEIVDLNACIKSVEDLLSVHIKEAKAKITYKSLDPVVGSSELLTRLLQNVIGNSIKYAKDDVQPNIKISTKTMADSVQISVEDNGIGIPAEHEAKVFQLFQRLHGEGEYDGLGLGLATCQRIAEIHNGSIRLDSEYTDGTRLLIEINTAQGSAE